MATLSVTKLTKSYPTPGERLDVLRGIDLSLVAGDHAAVVGPSGCGKSTLLSIVGTLERPTSGDVRIDGVDPFALDDRELSTFRNERIGFVFQEHFLLPQLTVRENVLLPRLARGRIDEEAGRRADDLLERVGLKDRVTHRPGELSGGERQRVAVARALIGRPTLVLADEPTGSLDQTTALSVLETLIELQQAERAIMLVVTHSAAIADRLGRVFALSGGRLAQAHASAG